jgi:hypothetical protein
MTPHPCEGLPTTHREAFERVCIGLPPGAPMSVLRVLVRRGLLDETFDVPVAHHMAWCQWCSDQNGASSSSSSGP